jgi:hypothetical protein
MGLGDSISEWLDGDPGQSFFEFAFAPDDETTRAHRDVELMCTKTYTPNGLVTIAIYFGGVYYLSLQDGGGEQPLLDSKFPNVAGKGRGYQIKAYSAGVDGWKSLRKVSVWQTQDAMQKEMEARMDQVRRIDPIIIYVCILRAALTNSDRLPSTPSAAPSTLSTELPNPTRAPRTTPSPTSATPRRSWAAAAAGRACSSATTARRPPR